MAFPASRSSSVDGHCWRCASSWCRIRVGSELPRPTVADRTHYKWVPRRIGGGTAVRPVPEAGGKVAGRHRRPLLLGGKTPDDIEERHRPAAEQARQVVVRRLDGHAVLGKEVAGEVTSVPSQ